MSDEIFHLTEEGKKLIYRFEVGGGKSYYDKFLKKPTVPPAFSGITILIGIDIGYTSKNEITKMLEDYLSNSDLKLLLGGQGLKKSSAKNYLPKVKHMNFTWEKAEQVFLDFTIPKFWTKLKRAFPGVEDLHPNAQAVLLSLVFNRGTKVGSGRRQEMLNIKRMVPKKDYKGIANELRKMKRLWPHIKGLQLRRDAEAELVESCME